MNACISVSVIQLIEREKRLTIKVGERKFSYRMVSKPIRSYRGEIAHNKPEFDRAVGVFHDTKYHD